MVVITRRRKKALLCLLLQRSLSLDRSLAPNRWWVRPIYQERPQQGDWFNLIPAMRNTDEESFRNYMRMMPSQMDSLLNLIGDKLEKFSMREPISPGERLAITLRYLASGDSMRSISYQYRVAPNTVSAIVAEVCGVLWSTLMPIVFSPLTVETWEMWAREYDAKLDFPHCLGAIDGKHCVIQAIAGSGSQFYNYKGTYSIVLLAAVSSQYRFIMVDIGAEGRSSDGGILKNSAFGKALAGNKLDLPAPKPIPGSAEPFPFVFVADEAFPLTQQIMRPYPGSPLGDEQIVFNYRLSRARMMVENTFGILSAKWRIYRRPVLGSLSLVKSIVQATVCLHNWLLAEEENLEPAERKYCSIRTPDSVDEEGNVIAGQWRSEVSDDDALRDLPSSLRLGSNRHSQDAAEIREQFTDFFMGRGQIDKQWHKIPVRW